MLSSTEQALLDKIESLSLLRELNDRLAGAADFGSACAALVELLWEERGLRPAAYFSVDASPEGARLEAIAPRELAAAGSLAYPLDVDPFATLLAHPGPQVLPAPLPSRWPGTAPRRPEATWMGVPMGVRQRVTGVLCVQVDRDAARQADDARLLGIVATSAALALDVARNGERAEFVAMLRHDIANPLSTALGYAELLVDQLGPDPGARSTVAVLDTIREQLRAINELVTSYLHMSAIDRGAPVVHWETVDLHLLLSELEAAFGFIARDKGLSLTAEIDHAHVRADRRQLQRVMANLVSNAIKYTPAPGQVSVRTTREGRHVVLAVRDTGLGIPLDQQARAFSKYARFHADSGIPGTGLGLYLSRGIVEAHGGTIDLESAPGCGSTFRVRLPCTEAA